MSKSDEFDEFVDDFLASGEKNPDESLEFLAGLAHEQDDEVAHFSRVQLSTTETIPGRTLIDSKGVVSGRVVRGQGMWKNFKMLMGSDALGKRSGALEKDFAAMEQECFKQIKSLAFNKGANAVIGVSLQYGETSGEANLFYVVATGTAVLAK